MTVVIMKQETIEAEVMKYFPMILLLGEVQKVESGMFVKREFCVSVFTCVPEGV